MDVIIQARMSSSRLPGKVMLTINDNHLIWYVYQRVKMSKKVDRIFIATSIDKSDDILSNYCNSKNIPCFRGSLDDVLDRFYQLAKKEKMKDIIRITADCPLIDYKIIDEMITYYKKEKGLIDYFSNVHPPNFPDGLDCEIFSFEVLEKSWRSAEKKSEREHVTAYIYNNSNLFRVHNYYNDKDYSSFRWVVDEQEDFDLIKKIYKHFNFKLNITMNDIIKYLIKNEELIMINSKYSRNEGYFKSIHEDEIFKK